MPDMTRTGKIVLASHLLIAASVVAFLHGATTLGRGIVLGFGFAIVALVVSGVGIVIAPTAASRAAPGVAFVTAILVMAACGAFLWHLRSELQNFGHQ